MNETLMFHLLLLNENSDGAGISVSAACFSVLSYRREMKKNI